MDGSTVPMARSWVLHGWHCFRFRRFQAARPLQEAGDDQSHVFASRFKKCCAPGVHFRQVVGLSVAFNVDALQLGLVAHVSVRARL